METLDAKGQRVLRDVSAALPGAGPVPRDVSVGSDSIAT